MNAARASGFCHALVVTTTELAELQHYRRFEEDLPPITDSLAYHLATDRYSALPNVRLLFETSVPNATYRARLFDLSCSGER